jgi:hypothetical protein
LPQWSQTISNFAGASGLEAAFFERHFVHLCGGIILRW